MSYYLFLLPIIFLCCLHLPYVYREPLEPASIDRVLILDRLVQHMSISEMYRTLSRNLSSIVLLVLALEYSSSVLRTFTLRH